MDNTLPHDLVTRFVLTPYTTMSLPFSSYLICSSASLFLVSLLLFYLLHTFFCIMLGFTVILVVHQYIFFIIFVIRLVKLSLCTCIGWKLLNKRIGVVYFFHLRVS